MSQDTFYEDQICEAIELYLNKNVPSAQFDKTIRATIASVVDADVGEYKVKQQDSLFTARAACPAIEQQKNTDVYVLVPLNDYANDKIILWSAHTTNHFGPQPITSMTIYANDEYEVTTREGVEKYRALQDEVEEEEEEETE